MLTLCHSHKLDSAIGLVINEDRYEENLMVVLVLRLNEGPGYECL